MIQMLVFGNSLWMGTSVQPWPGKECRDQRLPPQIKEMVAKRLPWEIAFGLVRPRQWFSPQFLALLRVLVLAEYMVGQMEVT